MENTTVGTDSPHQEQPETERRTPLPIKQLFIIAMVLLAEPLTNSIIRSFNDASTAATDPSQTFVDGDVPEASFYSQLLV
jgi:hypothetical protein